MWCSTILFPEHLLCIFHFRGRDCQLLFSYALDPEAPEPCAVSSLVPLPSLQRVAVGLTNGRLFLVRSDILPTSSTMGEGSFVMTELGSSTVLHSVTAVFKDQGRLVVWFFYLSIICLCELNYLTSSLKVLIPVSPSCSGRRVIHIQETWYMFIWSLCH